MGISSAGLGSGLDVNSIVSQLMSLEQRPVAALAMKEAKHQAQLSAYGSIKGALSSFQTSVAALASTGKFTAVNSSVADGTVATVTTTPNAAPATYSMEVTSIAQSQKLKSAAHAEIGASVGTGKLTISFGTYDADTFTLNPAKSSVDINIGAGQNSLTGIRDAINAANAGVTAGIINDGSGYRLTIAGKDTGLANAIRVAVADDDAAHTDNAGLSQLAFDARTVSGTTNLTQTVAAKNATVIIDGITITKPSNTISDAIQGVTLNLAKQSAAGVSTTLTVARDTGGVQNAVQSFVKAYNDLNTTLTKLTKYDPETKQASTLTGDSTVRTLQTQLRNAFNTPLRTAGGGFSALPEIGLTFQQDGTLKLDAAKLTAAMADGTKDVSTLFAAVGKPTDTLVAFAASTASTKNGSYDLALTQIATQGKAVGGAPAALTINASSNDTLELTIDGVDSVISLAPGTYTADSLAAEVQAKINGVAAYSSAGIKVGVTQSGGVLSVTSTKYGSASSVAVTGGSAKADLFGALTATAGVDVAGTIGGVAATGAGQTLTAKGDASGLALTISGGATGDRGKVSFARGYAYELDKIAGTMLGSNSDVESRINGIKSSIKEVDNRRNQLTQRLGEVEKRLRAQYATLDTMMAKMTGTSNYLSQQLASLPKMG